MPPRQTQNSALVGKTPADTEGDPVIAIEDSPSTSVIMSDDQPVLARAFNWLADWLLNTKRTPTFTRVWEPNLRLSLGARPIQWIGHPKTVMWYSIGWCALVAHRYERSVRL